MSLIAAVAIITAGTVVVCIATVYAMDLLGMTGLPHPE